jgi:AAA ATPase domain
VLLGRQRELALLNRLLAAARDRRGGAIVVLGEPGIGKTALIERTVTSAQDFRVLRTAGREGELELAFAALQQLCAPGLDRLERLPELQRDALGVVFEGPWDRGQRNRRERSGLPGVGAPRDGVPPRDEVECRAPRPVAEPRSAGKKARSQGTRRAVLGGRLAPPAAS